MYLSDRTDLKIIGNRIFRSAFDPLARRIQVEVRRSDEQINQTRNLESDDRFKS